MSRLSETVPLIDPDCEIDAAELGRFTRLARGTRIKNATFGDYSYTDRFADIANARVGKFVNIAAFARIGPTDHPMDGASLHHFLYRSGDYWDDAEPDPDFFARRRVRVTHVGNDTWIGHGAIVRPDLTVGHGAVVGASAVVTRDVAPYTIVAGVSAAPLRARHSADIAAPDGARLVGLAARRAPRRPARLPRPRRHGVSGEIWRLIPRVAAASIAAAEAEAVGSP